MPELPEVQTTVNGINEHVSGMVITDVWSDYNGPYYVGKSNIKDPAYFKWFRKQLIGSQILSAERRAKQILIHIDVGRAIAVHMKMTGHFLFGQWKWHKQEKKWKPPEGFWNKTWSLDKETVRKTLPFSDPYNDFIHLMFHLQDKHGNTYQLAFSDMRKFGSVSLLEDSDAIHAATKHLGPEPLQPRLSFDQFMSQLKNRPNLQVKTALLDQSLIAGFGNIYTDEVLWSAAVHPESLVGSIPEQQWQDIFTDGKRILKKALRYGGDSMGDYRKIDGRGGSYQKMHNAYQQDGQACSYSKCHGTIEKKQIGQRIGRFCPEHQILYI